MKLSFYKLLVFVVALILGACQDVPEYDETPKIQLESFQKEVIFDDLQQTTVDFFTINVRFEDGDGDLGMSRAQLDLIDTNLVDPKYRNNFHIELFKKVNGAFERTEIVQQSNCRIDSTTNQRICDFDTISLDGRFDELIEEDYVGPIDGVITHTFDIAHEFNEDEILTLNSGDVIKLAIYINDRSYNESNIIETSEVEVMID